MLPSLYIHGRYITSAGRWSFLFALQLSGLFCVTRSSHRIASPATVSPLALAEAGDGTPEQTVANIVMITVFGKTEFDFSQYGGQLPCSLMECPNPLREAGQWILTALLRSMLQRQAGEQMMSDEPPKVSISVVPPFGYADFLPHSTQGGQRSAFQRTFFRFNFSHTNESLAENCARNLCSDYGREEEEILKGILRALDISGVYPWQALKIAAHLGLNLNSVILLSSAVNDHANVPIIGMGCNWDLQVKHGTPQGAMYLPPCPDNAHHTDDSEKPWKCACNAGYQGQIKVHNLNSDTFPFSYSGECKEVIGFCKGNYSMRLQNGSAAKGVINEQAYAKCPKSFESTGMAMCIGRGEIGMWSPATLCRFVPPSEPPASADSPPDHPESVTPCRTPDTAKGTLDVSQCTAASRPHGEECLPSNPQCKCIIECAAYFRPVGGGVNGGQFRCNEAGEYTDLPICRPLCSKPDDQFGQLDTSSCNPCTADSQDCECKLACRGRHSGGGPVGKYKCVLQPGNDTVLAHGQWMADVGSLHEEPGIVGEQVPICLSPVFITVVDATSKDRLAKVVIEVFVNRQLIDSRRTDASGKVELTSVAEQEVRVIANLAGYASISRNFKRSTFCLDPTANCGMQLSMSKVLKHASLIPDGCYFTSVGGKTEWEMRAVLEWGYDPQDLDIWARNLDCYRSIAERYGCLSNDSSTCQRYKLVDPAVRKLEQQACGARRCLGWNSRTFLGRDGRPECPEDKVYSNQFTKWVNWRSEYVSSMHKRIEGSGDAAKVVPFKASSVRSVRLGGFPDTRESYVCGGQSCDLLNGEFIERLDPRYSVNGHRTYWKSDGLYFLYYCSATDTWNVDAVSGFAKIQASECLAFARSAPGGDIMSPAMISFVGLWDSSVDDFRPLTGASITALSVPDISGGSPWTDDSYMFLNVDHKTGYGPETITFHNAPPGTYQIAVNIFSRNDVNDNIKKGNPVVTIYVGGDTQAKFECHISPGCSTSSRVWNVVNIRVVDGGDEAFDGHPTGKRKYYLRLLDSFDSMEPLREVDLPTSGRTQDEEDKYHAPPGAKYFRVGPSEQYDDEELRWVCYGECTGPPGYDQCFERPP